MADLEWRLIERDAAGPIRRGDRVSVEAGGMPIYEVVEIDHERLWLRDPLSGRDHVLPAASLRWRLRRTAA